MSGWASRGEHQALDSSRVQVGHLCWREVVGDDHALAVDEDFGRPDQDASHLLADRMDVGCPGPKVRIRDRCELGLDRADGVEPGAGSGEPGADASVYVVQQLGVVDEHEVGVEDPCLAVAGFLCRGHSNALDLSSYIGDRCAQPPPLGDLAFGLLVRKVDVGRAGGYRRSDGDARRGSERAVVVRHRGSLLGGSGGGLVEPALGEGDDVLERLTRLSSGGTDLDAVAVESSERGDPGEAGRRNGPGSGVEVAQLHAGVVPPCLLDEAGGRAGMQAMWVEDLDDSRQWRDCRRPCRIALVPVEIDGVHGGVHV